MEEAIRNRIILILSLLTAILFVATIGSCGTARRQRLARDKEMAIRLDFEEKVGALEKQVASLNQELQLVKTAADTSGKSLAQEQLASQALKEELQKVTKLKETLEDDLKDALVKGKSRK